MDRDVTVYVSSYEPPDDEEPAPPEPAAPRNRRALVVAAAGAALGLLVVAGTVGGVLADNGPTASWRMGPDASATPSTPPSPADDTVTLAGVGDVIMGSAPNDLPPDGGRGFFDRVKKSLAADLVMGNLETPLTKPTGVVKCGWETPTPSVQTPSPRPVPASGCHQFSLPPSYAEHLSGAGFQVMNLANNHTFDMGRAGLDNTRDALASEGIKHTGAPGQITVVPVKGLKVAVLGFSIYGWTQDLNDIKDSAALVRKAARQADIVVVQMQGGAEGSDKSHVVVDGHEEFLGEDRGDLVAFTHAMIDAGADVVYGHGPHIMRGMEFYKGRLIAYSLGNFCGYRVLAGNGFLGVGGVLKVRLHPDGTWADGTLVATEMVDGGYPAVDKQKRAIDFVNDLSRDDFGPSAVHLDSKGKITPADA